MFSGHTARVHIASVSFLTLAPHSKQYFLCAFDRLSKLGCSCKWLNDGEGAAITARITMGCPCSRPAFHLVGDAASFGASQAASFWKRGSFRSGSNMGSSRSSVGVSGESFALLFRRLQGDDFLEARVAAKHSR